MTEDTKTTKVDKAFGKIEPRLEGLSSYQELVARTAFALGAQAFSTMPLCEHGVAVWGLEYCGPCAEDTAAPIKDLETKKEEAVFGQDFELVESLRDKIAALKEGGPGEFPGYNRPFEAELPEGMTQGHLEDLKAEHETLRLSLLQALIKVGVIDQEATNAPWDAVTLTHFTGLWLQGAMPWVKQGRKHREIMAGLSSLDQRTKSLETRLVNHLQDHEEKKP